MPKILLSEMIDLLMHEVKLSAHGGFDAEVKVHLGADQEGVDHLYIGDELTLKFTVMRTSSKSNRINVIPYMGTVVEDDE